MTSAAENSELQRLIRGNINIPSPPAIAVEILNIIQNDESSLEDLGNVISADPALTGKILRLANSAFYSLSCEVGNIQRALTILGTNVVKNIALSFVFADQISGKSTSSFDFDYFWKRSVIAGIAAESLLDVVKDKNDDLFVTALLQDIGVLVMYLCKGERYARFLNNYKREGASSLCQAERVSYSFDHQQLAYLLLQEWGLPSSITTPIEFHHASGNAPLKCRKWAMILEAADLFSGIYCSPETAEKVRSLETLMETGLNVSPSTTRKL